MISFEHVSKFILHDVSIHIPKGITLGIIGATGSGKTTFIKLCCGLLVPMELKGADIASGRGNVYVMGHKPATMPNNIKAHIGALFADIPVLKAEETVVNNFDSLRHIYGLDKRFFYENYDRFSKELGFYSFQYEKVSSLSLGQRRRAELGVAFIHNPKLLLLDEPTIGIDQAGKEAVRKLIKEREKTGLTTVVTSHDMADIVDVCTRICILDKGRVCYYGDKDIIFKRYAPVDVMNITLQDKIPDLGDLPFRSYDIDGNELKLIYNSNHITSAEILKAILPKCPIKEVSIHKPNLTDVIMKIERGISDE